MERKTSPRRAENAAGRIIVEDEGVAPAGVRLNRQPQVIDQGNMLAEMSRLLGPKFANAFILDYLKWLDLSRQEAIRHDRGVKVSTVIILEETKQ